MFGFKSLTVLLAAGATIVSALPTGSSNALAKREPVANAVAVALPERDVAVVSVDAAVTVCVNALADIYADIDVAVKAKADVAVFVGILGRILTVLVDLTANINAFVKVNVNVAGILGINLTALVSVYVDLFVALVAQLKIIVLAIAKDDLHLIVAVFTSICLQIVLAVNAFVAVCAHVSVLGGLINIDVNAVVIAFLNLHLKAVVDVLVELFGILGIAVTADVYVKVKALVALKAIVGVGINL